MECTRLRVKNVPFDRHQLIVRDGQGGKDRITLLPDSPSPMETEPMGPLPTGSRQWRAFIYSLLL